MVILTLNEKYITALKQNIEQRFHVFMSSIPTQCGHGIASLRVLANHYYQDSGCKEQETEELFSEWNKVKFDLLKWKSHMPEPSVMQMDFKETPSNEVRIWPLFP